jgi:hypothetical protein
MVLRRSLVTGALALLAGSQAFGQSFTLTDTGSSFTVLGPSTINNTWNVPSVPYDVSFNAQWLYRLGTSGAFQNFSTLTYDSVNSGLSGTSVLNLFFNGSGFNVAVRYSLLGGTTNAQVSEQVRVTNTNNSAATFQLIQYNNYDTSNNLGTGDAIQRTNSSSVTQTGSGATPAVLQAGSTAIPTFSQIGQEFLPAVTGAGFGNLDSAAGANVGQTVSPSDAAYAFQWNTSISAGGTFQVGTDKIVGAVPEPASMAVLGLGALALIRRRRARA